MTSQHVAEKSEKSLGELLVVVVIVALLMASFIFYFFKHENKLTSTGFKSVSNVFSARVNVIRAQWFMDLQPKYVEIESGLANNQDKAIKIPVNGDGWVDIEESSLKCQSIWQYVMESPLVYMKKPIGAVLVKAKSKNSPSYCHFSLSDVEYFTYQSKNGKVTLQQ